MDYSKLFNMPPGFGQIISDLYRPENPGGFGIKDFLNEDFRGPLLEEAKRGEYRPAKWYIEDSKV